MGHMGAGASTRCGHDARGAVVSESARAARGGAVSRTTVTRRSARAARGGLAWRRPAARLLAPWVARLRGVEALVWGDFVLDEYWRCRSSRVSREAPVLVLDYESRVFQGGGAANAALNLAAL